MLFKEIVDGQRDLNFLSLPINQMLDLVGLELNGPVNTIKVMSSPSVYLTTIFPGQA